MINQILHSIITTSITMVVYHIIIRHYFVLLKKTNITACKVYDMNGNLLREVTKPGK
jgi:hypothetical protein